MKETTFQDREVPGELGFYHEAEDNTSGNAKESEKTRYVQEDLFWEEERPVVICLNTGLNNQLRLSKFVCW